jgi:hypothetical protein
MRKLLFLLLACLGAAACDDIIFTDGRTLADGHVIDSLTNQRVAGAKVYLFTCGGLFNYRCNRVLDSTTTNADGYYRFRFMDQRRTDFGVAVGAYPANDFVALPVVAPPDSEVYVVNGSHFQVKEGKRNRFDFFIRFFKTARVHLRINPGGYQDVTLNTRYQDLRFKAPPQPLDTVLYLKAAPNADLFLSGYLYAPDKPQIRAEKWVYVGEADTTRVEVVF